MVVSVALAQTSIAARCSFGEMRLSPARPPTRETLTYPSIVFIRAPPMIQFTSDDLTTRARATARASPRRRVPSRRPLCDSFCKALRALGLAVETGAFGARMEVELVNDGPVTIILE
jgi:D-Tyr-tRNA(Tyr) deacylase